ncbi:MAG TPA: RtcB family protein [Actinobacteria bacterium]|nr:RtcB family protein [Actinomycetota bacterium]
MAQSKRQAPLGLRLVKPFVYEVPKTYKRGMRVPGRVFASENLIMAASEDKAIEQVANVACLPGIVRASYAMPDIHWGYGFPIGGVAATRVEGGVVSPGGVGFDISCGVRLLRTDILAAEIKSRIKEITHELARAIPKGLGGTGRIQLTRAELNEVLSKGAAWCVAHGYGWPQDLETIEHDGTYKNADPETVSEHAKDRGLKQLGTLGSGNHFVEIQEVTEVYDPAAADVLALSTGQLTVMIHSGSRGLGHQVCTDYLREMGTKKIAGGFEMPDRQLACTPIESSTGKRYLGAMAAAANFGLANRQAITHWVRESFSTLFGADSKDLGMSLIYDISHNVAQFENHEVDGVRTDLCVHRKGATRAFGPGQPEVPDIYRRIGQPVIIPGDMGTASYVLVGTDQSMEEAFGSTCHGAGRVMSRKAAKKKMKSDALVRELSARGIVVESGNMRLLSEEAPYAYKDISEVVDVCQEVGLSKKVARLRPLGVLKG